VFDMGVNHDHSHDEIKLSGVKIFWVTVLNTGITIVEFIGGVMSGSLSLLSDAVHNLSDAAAVAISYFAWKIAGKEKDVRKTYGYKRAEIIAAFINASALVVISLFLVLEAIKRFRNPEPINGTIMLIVAAVGLAANMFSVALLEKDAHGNLNIRSSYLHLLGDTVSSIGVLLGGALIKLWGVTWIDPAVTVLIALYIILESWKIMKKTVDILMQSSADLDYAGIQRDVEALPEVRNIHHVHTWLFDENTIHMEAHVDLDDCMLSDTCAVSDRIEEMLRDRYGVSHVTIQFETDRCREKNFFKL
jgi:cobalt-zinc-cadmium efflux system protein